MDDGWRMLGLGCVIAYGALTLLRCVADEVAHTTRALEALEKQERQAREKRNEEAETITVAEAAV